jgi:hypothetical protein
MTAVPVIQNDPRNSKKPGAASVFPNVLVMICFGVLLFGSVSIAAPTQKPAPAPTASKSAGTQTNAPEAEIPVSVFTMPANPKEGKDPFFPNRVLDKVAPQPIVNKEGAKPVPVALILNGLSGSANRPLAIINNYTFAKGEEADVRSGTSRVHVRCVDIKEDYVIVEVNGQRQELRLRLSSR